MYLMYVVCLEPSQTSTVEFFSENSQRLELY